MAREAAEEKREAGKGKKSKTPIIIGAVVLAAAVGIGAYLWLSRPEEPEEEGRALREVVSQENAHRVVDSMMSQEPVRPGSYLTSMTTEWHFENGSAASEDAYVENDPANTGDIYFDVELDETGEVIYESPVLPLGTYVEQIKLKRDLEAGTYPAIVVYHLIDQEQNTLSTVQVRVSIIVEH